MKNRNFNFSNYISTSFFKKEVLIALIIVQLLFLFYPQYSYAERCWMVDGCRGNVYVYIPAGHYDKPYVEKYNCNKEIYSEGYDKVFDYEGLPNVNEIVKIYRTDTTGFDNIKTAEESYQKHDDNDLTIMKTKNLPRQCSIMKYMTYRNHSGMLLMGGMKVKILSYTKIKSGLIALVNILPNQIGFDPDLHKKPQYQYFIK